MIVLCLCSCQKSGNTLFEHKQTVTATETGNSVVITQPKTEIITDIIKTGLESQDIYRNFLETLYETHLFDYRFYFYDIDMDGNNELIFLCTDDYGNVHFNIFDLTNELPIQKASLISYNESAYQRGLHNLMLFPKQIAIYYDDKSGEYFIVSESTYVKEWESVPYSADRITFYSDGISLENLVCFNAEPFWTDGFDFNEIFIYQNLFGYKESNPRGYTKISELSRFNDELEGYLNQYDLIKILDFGDDVAYVDEKEVIELIKKYSMELIPSKLKSSPPADKLFAFEGEFYDIERTIAMRFYYGDEYGVPNLGNLKVFSHLHSLTLMSYNTDDELNLSPLSSIESLRILNIEPENNNESLVYLDQIEFLFGISISAMEDFKYIREMKSLKNLSLSALNDAPDYFSFLEDYENSNIEWLNFYGTKEQLENVRKSFHNLTFINFAELET
jgi:hypothetical protein